VNKARLEAFSDGVMAVAITLLVLDLHLDTGPSHASIPSQLRHDWPSYAAYATSFLVIGVMWVNHHALLALAARVNRHLMWANLWLLMWVCTVPFTTATFAGLLADGGDDARWGVFLYGLSMIGCSIGFTGMLRRLAYDDLLLQPIPREQARKAVRRFGLGLFVYPVAVLIGLVVPVLGLVAYFAIAAYYVFEQTPILPGATSGS
jgi:uncharacterized membrane protein